MTDRNYLETKYRSVLVPALCEEFNDFTDREVYEFLMDNAPNIGKSAHVEYQQRNKIFGIF